MVVVGVDVHKDTHTFVAVDEVGRSVRQSCARPMPDTGKALRWARAHSAPRWSSRSRTAGTSRPGWRRALLAAGGRWCGCRRS